MARTVLLLLLAAALQTGCTRAHYRLQADAQTYGLIAAKSAGAPWQPPADFTIEPDPLSRFYDPTGRTHPCLPIPAPQLYAYELPEFVGSEEPSPGAAEMNSGDLRAHDYDRMPEEGLPEEVAAPPVRAAAWQVLEEQLPEPEEQPAARQESLPGDDPSSPDLDLQQVPGEAERVEDLGQIRVVPLPREAWQNIPDHCLDRMLEFESLRSEFSESYGEAAQAAPEEEQRIGLRAIVRLAQINNRALQLEKETLYRTALQLSLERYDYELKFTPTGNGTDLLFSHQRDQGFTVNTLSIQTTAAVNKMLLTGGDFLARFANNVFLTFNGPQGFTADVGSELLFELFQPILQRDVRFEALTQAERDVVYAARDYARFRRVLFRDLASAYYQLLLAYRNIEIDAQDYFSNYRAFQQGQAEYRFGRLPRVQVDQFEQNMLASRSDLIRSCNNLESELDRLKLLIGLPPELPLNLDLQELQELTLRDEATVSLELVRRTRRDLLVELDKENPDESVVVNAAAELARRLLALAELRTQLDQQEIQQEELRQLLAQLLLDEARLLAQYNRQVLIAEQQAVPPVAPLRIFQRQLETLASALELVQRRLELAQLHGATPEVLQPLEERLQQLREQAEAIRERLASLEAAVRQQLDQRPGDQAMQQIPELVEAAASLLEQTDRLVEQAKALPPAGETQREFREIVEQVDQVLEIAQQVLEGEQAGLAPIEIDMDEAMLTALTQRLELMNQRGELADVWRQVKLTADDLRSVLNLRATQEIRTRDDVNRPFGFTFDESQTNLALEFDAPLNRRAQRNSYRVALINYQVALRNLMQLEDQIKLAVRDDLRELTLDRNQYQIAVASAALAYERVVSTRLQLQLGVEDVAARDFLEAQQAYTESLSAVALQHVSYIVDRIDLFLDLEAVQVTQLGFWPELYNEDLQPQPNFLWPPDGRAPYGELPPVWYSQATRRMECVPAGHPMIWHAEEDSAESATDEHGETD